MALWSFSEKRMNEIKNRIGEDLFLKVIYRGHPFLVEGEVDSVRPFVSISLNEKFVTILETSERFRFNGVAKFPFMWKGIGIQVISEKCKIIEEEKREVFAGIIYENHWVGDDFNINEAGTVRSMFSAIYGEKVALAALPKIEEEQQKEEKLRKAWIKISNNKKSGDT